MKSFVVSFALAGGLKLNFLFVGGSRPLMESFFILMMSSLLGGWAIPWFM